MAGPLLLRGLFIVVGALVESGVIASIAESMVGAVDNTGQAMIIVAWFTAVARQSLIISPSLRQ